MGIKWQSLFFFLFAVISESGSVAADNQTSFFLYGGASTSASLLNIIKVSIPDLNGFYMTTLGASRSFVKGSYVALEIEAQLSKHLEKASSLSIGSAFVFRWLKVPWERMIPGSFAIGNGLSYSTELLEVETSAIQKTSRLLYHILLEFEFQFGQNSTWSGFIRDHHRSGIFGLFDGVTGGSDYLCLGVRYHLP